MQKELLHCCERWDGTEVGRLMKQVDSLEHKLDNYIVLCPMSMWLSALARQWWSIGGTDYTRSAYCLGLCNGGQAQDQEWRRNII